MVEQSSKTDSIFWSALGIADPDKRDRYLEDACADDPNLRAQLDELLAAYPKVEPFLEQPAIAADATVLQAPPIAERPGTVIGPYKLLQQIGEGGMGVVFMAEQAKPIQRTVALKIIKPGMDTRQVIARFEAERQALAMMDHPNIAKVLDAGTTDSGRPYFVMELVKGVPITKYCDEKQLSLRERLDLFLPICQAVQHAHQKGIIHRDIKPTNVLVAEYDKHAIPKVIDFGVAKATAQKLTERTMFTEFGQVVGTFEYMSPEQAKLNQLDIDTRSDIYSLGVLLYELLTGETPFDRKRLHSAAFDEVLRIIREEDPPKPSTKLSSSDTLPSIAVNRHTEPARLSKDIRGELDWIVMKCLEKDRNRRYETANAFERDLERYLRNEQVQAYPPSAAYRFRKFVRRNKGPVAAIAAVLLTLALGLALAIIGFVDANRQRTIAQSNAARADREANNARNEAETQLAINGFLIEMLRAPARERALGGKYVTILQVLDQAGRHLNQGFMKGRPKIEATIRANLYMTYRDFGQLDVAERHLRKAIELAKQAYGPDHPIVADYLHDLGADLLTMQGRLTEAEAVTREALAIHQRVFGQGSLETIVELVILRGILVPSGKLAEAEQLFDQALAIAQKALGQENIEAKVYKSMLDDVARVMVELARELRARGRMDEADALFRLAIALSREAVNVSENMSEALIGRAEELQDAGNLVEAEELHREALAIVRKAASQENAWIERVLESLTSNLRAQGKSAEIKALWRERLQYWQQELAAADTSRRRAEVHLRMFRSLMNTGQIEQSKASCRMALELDAMDAGSVPELNRNARALATSLDPAHRDPALAVALAEKAVEHKPTDGTLWNTLGVARYRAGDWQAARMALEKSMELREGGDAVDWFVLAMTCWQLGLKDEARQWYDKAVEWTEKNQQENEELRGFRAEAAELLGLSEPTSPSQSATDN